MKKFSTLIATLALLVGLATPLVMASSVGASNASALCEGSGGTWKADASLTNGGTCSSEDKRTVTGTLSQITNVLIFLVGAIAVLMIIIGGLRYVTSGGDQAGTTSAKNTILYSVIGLIVAFMAYAIVNFVFSSFNIK